MLKLTATLILVLNLFVFAFSEEEPKSVGIFFNNGCGTNKNLPLYENNIQNCNKYYSCINKLWWSKLVVQTCPDGTGFSATTLECDENISPTTCEDISKRATPNCDKQINEKFPFYENNIQNCQKYYECGQTLWWWQLNEKTCPDGYGFSATTLECQSNISPTTCEETFITPNCNKQIVEKFPFYENNILNCRKYYECGPKLWWWQPYEKTCPQGTGFSVTDLECSANIPCLRINLFNDIITNSSTPDLKLVNAESSNTTCSGTPVNGTLGEKLPVYDANNTQICNQYYQCVYAMWWWSPVLLNCTTDTVFSIADEDCIPGSSC